MMRLLKSHPEIKLVVLSSAWQHMGSFLIPDNNSKPNQQVGSMLFERALDSTVKEIAMPGRQIVLLGTAPQWPSEASFECTYRNPALWRAPCSPEKKILSEAVTIESERESAEIMLRVAQRNAGTSVIFPAVTMCTGGKRLTELDGEPLLYGYRPP